MRASDDKFFTKREAAELQMAEAQASLRAAAVHHELAGFYRRKLGGIAAAVQHPALRAAQPLSRKKQLAAATPSAHALQNDSWSKPSQSVAESCCVIEERPDGRGMLIYVVVEHGVEITSRWTRADADLELQRLDALRA